MRDWLAETELLIQNSGHMRGKNGSSILGITDKHCRAKAGALGDT